MAKHIQLTSISQTSLLNQKEIFSNFGSLNVLTSAGGGDKMDELNEYGLRLIKPIH